VGNIGDTFPYSVPTVGSAGPAYATSVDNILTEAISRLSAKIPLSSLQFSANLDLSGQALLNAAYLTLVNASSTPGASPVNRLTTYLGDLWYVSPSGPIQLTTGAALNSASIGGITGNYGGANPAQLTYVSAQTRYDAYANFGTGTWAYLRALGFDIAANATSTVFARLLFGGVSNLTFTLPPTVPAAGLNAVMTVSDTGAITQGVTITQSPSLSGAAQYKHTNNRQISHIPNLSELSVISGSPGTTAGAPGVTMLATTDVYFKTAELLVGQQLQSVVLTTNSAANATYTLYKTNGPSLPTTVTGAANTTASATVILTPSVPTPVLAGDQYYVRINGNVGNITVYYLTTSFSNP
jgi:hypothetical protein